MVHQLYNNLEQSHTENVNDLKEVLLKVYTQLNETHDDVRLVNRLTNYIYSTALTEHITFNSEQQNLIT
ncbi:bacteriocin immunity protein [Enterococcus saccharolyticus]|uniref:bacteriocin immunity protein n=1 Tax=Enterococcus saccharolyticus TaxID=41997 RepID=UPI0023519A70|nr:MULTISPECIES: bacteriocin immunity protein [Enterococcus]